MFPFTFCKSRIIYIMSTKMRGPYAHDCDLFTYRMLLLGLAVYRFYLCNSVRLHQQLFHQHSALLKQNYKGLVPTIHQNTFSRCSF